MFLTSSQEQTRNHSTLPLAYWLKYMWDHNTSCNCPICASLLRTFVLIQQATPLHRFVHLAGAHIRGLEGELRDTAAYCASQGPPSPEQATPPLAAASGALAQPEQAPSVPQGSGPPSLWARQKRHRLCSSCIPNPSLPRHQGLLANSRGQTGQEPWAPCGGRCWKPRVLPRRGPRVKLLEERARNQLPADQRSEKRIRRKGIQRAEAAAVGEKENLPEDLQGGRKRGGARPVKRGNHWSWICCFVWWSSYCCARGPKTYPLCTLSPWGLPSTDHIYWVCS